MRRFVLGWKKLGLEQSLGTRLVTYADDLVILCRKGNAEAALHHLREIMGKLKLTVNEDKTRICKVPEGEFDFLGYSFGRMYSPTTGKARLAQRPNMFATPSTSIRWRVSIPAFGERSQESSTISARNMLTSISMKSASAGPSASCLEAPFGKLGTAGKSCERSGHGCRRRCNCQTFFGPQRGVRCAEARMAASSSNQP
jgi:hypothetical protein